MEIINGQVVQTTTISLAEYIEQKKSELEFHQNQLVQTQYQIDRLLTELSELV